MDNFALQVYIFHTRRILLLLSETFVHSFPLNNNSHLHNSHCTIAIQHAHRTLVGPKSSLASQFPLKHLRGHWDNFARDLCNHSPWHPQALSESLGMWLAKGTSYKHIKVVSTSTPPYPQINSEAGTVWNVIEAQLP